MKETSKGLILKTVNVGESDRLLTVLTADRGKITVSAKGVRSLKSKNASLCRPFTYVDIEYYERSGHFWLASGDILNSFFVISSDIEALSLASYFADVADELSGENFSDELLLRLLLNTLYATENRLYPLEQIKGAFEFFVMAHAGFAPDVSACERCGETLSEKKQSFVLDVMNGSLLCSECLNEKKLPTLDEIAEYDKFSTKNILIPLTGEVIMAIRYVLCADLKRLFSFSLTKQSDVSLFSHAAEVYLQNHLERGFDTLNFYRDVTR